MRQTIKKELIKTFTELSLAVKTKILATGSRKSAADLADVSDDDILDSSEDEVDTNHEGILATSSSSSDFDEGIPFPTRPKVIVKRSNVEQAQGCGD